MDLQEKNNKSSALDVTTYNKRSLPTQSRQQPSKKKMKTSLRKAPQAPKRFKSNYILFFEHVQESIRAELDGKSSAPAVSKKASIMWKGLSPEERLHWDSEALKEKARYLAEKAAYTGPWQVPHKRAKKDPTAPKRNPSAFLLYSQERRKELKRTNPGLKNTVISQILGQDWRNASEEDKRPHIEREVKERDQYKKEMEEWRKKKALLKKQEKINIAVKVETNMDQNIVENATPRPDYVEHNLFQRPQEVPNCYEQSSGQYAPQMMAGYGAPQPAMPPHHGQYTNRYHEPTPLHIQGHNHRQDQCSQMYAQDVHHNSSLMQQPIEQSPGHYSQNQHPVQAPQSIFFEDWGHDMNSSQDDHDAYGSGGNSNLQPPQSMEQHRHETYSPYHTGSYDDAEYEPVPILKVQND